MKILISDKMVSRAHSVRPDLPEAIVREILESVFSDLAGGIEASITAWQRGNDNLWHQADRNWQAAPELEAIADAQRYLLMALGAQFKSRTE